MSWHDDLLLPPEDNNDAESEQLTPLQQEIIKHAKNLGIKWDIEFMYENLELEDDYEPVCMIYEIIELEDGNKRKIHFVSLSHEDFADETLLDPEDLFMLAQSKLAEIDPILTDTPPRSPDGSPDTQIEDKYKYKIRTVKKDEELSAILAVCEKTSTIWAYDLLRSAGYEEELKALIGIKIFLTQALLEAYAEDEVEIFPLQLLELIAEGAFVEAMCARYGFNDIHLEARERLRNDLEFREVGDPESFTEITDGIYSLLLNLQTRPSTLPEIAKTLNKTTAAFLRTLTAGRIDAVPYLIEVIKEKENINEYYRYVWILQKTELNTRKKSILF